MTNLSNSQPGGSENSIMAITFSIVGKVSWSDPRYD
jgi:hypothetical protein